MDLLYSGNFGTHQWFSGRIRNPVVVLLIQKEIYSTWVILASTSGLSGIGNLVVVL